MMVLHWLPIHGRVIPMDALTYGRTKIKQLEKRMNVLGLLCIFIMLTNAINLIFIHSGPLAVVLFALSLAIFCDMMLTCWHMRMIKRRLNVLL